MPDSNSVPQTQVRNDLALVPHFASQSTQDPSTTQSPATDHEVHRFLERHRAQALGHELPLDTKEAAAYVGFHPKTVERMAREEQIPAHPASGDPPQDLEVLCLRAGRLAPRPGKLASPSVFA